jgi:hypothetical protein
MTYAANLGRDTIIRMLREMGATDLESAAGRAALQGHPDTVRMIYELAGRPSLEKWSLAGPAYGLWVNYVKSRPDDASFTQLLLDRGADPNVRASLRARLEEGHGGGPLREYRDVTPLGWGERYDATIFVSRESLRLIEAHGGRR